MSEGPQQLFDEAAELNFRLDRGWEAWPEVITWADSWIERLDLWPDELTEISLNGRRKDSEARRALAELARRGRFDAASLVRRALASLRQARSPYEIINDLYPLTYNRFLAGGLDFDYETPEPICTAIYQLDYIAESIDPEYGWAKMPEEDAEKYLTEEIHSKLEAALAEIECHSVSD